MPTSANTTHRSWHLAALVLPIGAMARTPERIDMKAWKGPSSPGHDTISVLPIKPAEPS